MIGFYFFDNDTYRANDILHHLRQSISSYPAIWHQAPTPPTLHDLCVATLIFHFRCDGSAAAAFHTGQSFAFNPDRFLVPDKMVKEPVYATKYVNIKRTSRVHFLCHGNDITRDACQDLHTHLTDLSNALMLEAAMFRLFSLNL